MICPNCGTNLADGTKACVMCGYWVAEAPQGKNNEDAEIKSSNNNKHGGSTSCPKCGNAVPDGKPFCPMCGTKLDISGGRESSSINAGKEGDNATGAGSDTAGSVESQGETLNIDPKPPGKSKKKVGIIGGICAAGAAAGIIIPLVIVNAGKPALTLEEQLESLQAKAETASSLEEYEKIYKEAEEVKSKLEESIFASESVKAQSELASIQAEEAKKDAAAIQSESQTQSQAQTQAQTTEAAFAESSSQTKTTAATTTAFDSSKTETKAATSSNYEVVKKDISWSDATLECTNKGGHLATITSESEMNELVELAESKGLRYVWLGGYTVVLDNDVYSYWMTDEPFSYTKWYPGEPSGTDEDGELEGALMMWRINGEWTWNDQRDDVVNSGYDYFKGYTGYICEYD